MPISRSGRCFRLLLASVPLLFLSLSGARANDSSAAATPKNSIDVCPMSPLFKIYALQYGYRISASSEIVLGPYYANIHYKDIGNTNAPGIILGYRHYLWESLHIEYQLVPQWDHFYEKNENRTYPQGFDLWNEFRLGYTWDFSVGSLPAFVTVQWPFGFALYSDGNAKPESFKQHVKDNPFFYFPPMFFVGVRF